MHVNIMISLIMYQKIYTRTSASLLNFHIDTEGSETQILTRVQYKLWKTPPSLFMKNKLTAQQCNTTLFGVTILNTALAFFIKMFTVFPDFQTTAGNQFNDHLNFGLNNFIMYMSTAQ